MSEQAILVDEGDRLVGSASRAEVRARNLLHRGIGILCRNGREDIYVHRRTAIKDVFPSMYDMFVGGMATVGESYDDAAQRELAEELGIKGVVPRFLFKYLYLGDLNRCWTAIYEVTWDGPIVPQESEIEWGQFMSATELNDKLALWHFVPDGLEIYFRYLEFIRQQG